MAPASRVTMIGLLLNIMMITVTGIIINLIARSREAHIIGPMKLTTLRSFVGLALLVAGGLIGSGCASHPAPNYHHDGFYDDKKQWHGGYYDEDRRYHEDPMDYHS